jgi:hypothetical protein
MFSQYQPGNDLLLRPSDAVLAEVKQHYGEIECSRWWQDVAEVSSSRAACSTGLSEGVVLAWATIAVVVFDRLGEICPEGSGSFTTSSMGLRAFMINRLGPRAGHVVLDPTVLEEWFFRRLELPYEEAISKSRQAASLPTDEFLLLNRLKDRIRIMRSVQSQHLFRQEDELSRWYALLGW